MGIPVTATEVDLLAELQELHRECHRLNRKIELAVLRQRFSSDPEEVRRGAAEEQKWLQELDHRMTRLRAVESHLKRVEEGGPTVLH